MNTLTSRASSYGIYYWTDLVEQQIKVARWSTSIQTGRPENRGSRWESMLKIQWMIFAECRSFRCLSIASKAIRVDNGLSRDGYPIYYDPMLCKLITYGETREEAIHDQSNWRISSRRSNFALESLYLNTRLPQEILTTIL
jgi:acetyl/propionyl-CoA carboxylase alpha subunit